MRKTVDRQRHKEMDRNKAKEEKKEELNKE